MNDKSSPGYKIGSLQVENFMRLSAVYIEPNGNLIEITGQNGVGKTSVLNAIWVLIGGKKAVPGQPVRKGEEKAIIRAELGDLIVTRRFNTKDDGYTTDVTVESADGLVYRKPQHILDALIGVLSFDPLAILRMEPDEQFAAFRQFVPEIDFNAVDAENRRDAEQRTEINRGAKQFRAQAAGIVIPENAPTVRINDDALIEELENAGKHNAERSHLESEREAAVVAVCNLHEQAHSLRERAADLRRQADEADRTAAETEERATSEEKRLAEASALPDPVDTTELRARIDEARAHNAIVDRVEQRRGLETRAADLEAQSDNLTKAIRLRNEQVATEIAAAKMPVEGISLAGGAVTFNGLPFSQASHAEQLRVSVAIAAAMNPKLKMALIRDGSTLDKKSWALLAELADKFDFQLFVETVDSDRPGAVVIEDGHLKGEVAEAAE